MEKSETEKNTDEILKKSGGAIKVASAREMADMNGYNAPYVNKFLCSGLRNNMVHIGFATEHSQTSADKAPDSEFRFSFITDVQSLANLHQLLSQYLTAFQQEQMRQMQALQGKVNPNFVEQIKAAQEAQSGKTN